MMPNTDMKQAALLNPYGIGNAGTGYQKSRTGVIDYNYLTLIK